MFALIIVLMTPAGQSWLTIDRFPSTALCAAEARRQIAAVRPPGYTVKRAQCAAE